MRRESVGKEELAMILTQKETELLRDLKNQEKLCTEKYRKYAEAAHDPQLKNLFSESAGVESHHLQILEQIEKGPAPTPEQKADPKPKTFNAHYSALNDEEKQSDAYLCSDLLATEKHVSSLYDTCIFEFVGEDLRRVLNAIQYDEQQHGKALYDYMSANSMYA